MNKVEYWRNLAEYDIDTAKAMLDTQRYLYVGFMCHQAMEKILKAYYVKINNEMPPYTHKLVFLAKKSGLYEEMTEQQKDFLDFLEPLNIEARYPATTSKFLKILTPETCKELIRQINGEVAWIISKL